MRCRIETNGVVAAPPPQGPSRLTPAQNESLVNFLVRVAFISGEAKDRDEVGVYP